MGRTKGAFNRPKFAYVQLGHLCRNLKDNALVPVDIKFLKALEASGVSFDGVNLPAEPQAQPEPEKEDLQFVVIEPQHE